MPRSPATRRSDASNPAEASGSAHSPNMTSPHPALVGLASLMGRAAAREAFAWMSRMPDADGKAGQA